MQKLDSTKLLIPIQALDSVDSSSYFIDTRTEPVSGSQTTTYKLKPDCINQIGLKSVTLNKDSEQATIELSAKALRGDYPRGISADTIEQALSNISSDSCKLNIPRVLDTAQVLRADITENVPISSDLSYYPASLGAYRYLNSRYRFELHNRTGYESVVIAKNAKSKGYRGRLTGYNKQGELSRAGNRDITQYLSESDFKNTLRLEQNFKGVIDLKKALGIPDTMLGTVFNSPATPLLDTLNDITKVLDSYEGIDYMEASIMSQFAETGDKRWYDKYRKLRGDRSIAGDYGNDIQQIELALSSGGHSRKHIWSLKHSLIEAVAINRHQESLKEGKSGCVDSPYVSELRSGLEQIYQQ